MQMPALIKSLQHHQRKLKTVSAQKVNPVEEAGTAAAAPVAQAAIPEGTVIGDGKPRLALPA